MAAAPSVAPPPSVADVDGAQSWYYRDDAGGEQGPFPATNMRSWLLHGMLPHSTAVAPSFYGEVPQDFWTISQIWENPTVAWAGADAQLQQPAAPAAGGMRCPDTDATRPRRAPLAPPAETARRLARVLTIGPMARVRVMARARARVRARAAKVGARGRAAEGATPTGLSHPTSVGSGRSQQPRAPMRIPDSPQLAHRNHRTPTAHDPHAVIRSWVHTQRRVSSESADGREAHTVLVRHRRVRVYTGLSSIMLLWGRAPCWRLRHGARLSVLCREASS